MHSLKITFLCILAHFLPYTEATNLAVSDKSKATNNGTEKEGLDDRFNFNVNHAHASGQNQYGASRSDSLSYGTSAGILRPGGHYQGLYSNTGSQSNAYSSGAGAPLTYANTGSRVGQGYGGGNAQAGLYGGHGSAYTTSHNQNIAIPLDNQGTVLLSNLKERNSTAKTESSTTTGNSKKTVTVDSDSLVF